MESLLIPTRTPTGPHGAEPQLLLPRPALATDAVGQVLACNQVLLDLVGALAARHEMLEVTMNSIGDAVVTTDAANRVSWLNPVAERLTGWPLTEATGRPIAEVFHIVDEDTRQPALSPAERSLHQGRTVGLPSHTLLLARGGKEYGIEDSAAPIRNAEGEILGVVLVFHDVTVQRHMSGEMTYRATHDALTSLVNRAEFETRLQRCLLKAQQEGSEHALLYIDLDQFKLVNDVCGHAVGDLLLQQIAKLLGAAVRERDTLARLGGDEFGVILEHCSLQRAQVVGQQICARMEEFPFAHEGRRFRVGASIGLVPITAHWHTGEAILQAADTSCYAAKDAGRNRVHTWFDTDQAMRERHGEKQWTSRIEQALAEDRFVLYAQRIDALATTPGGVHAELLLRMRGADDGLILPGAFLPAAERFHLATRIDRWVLARAVAWIAGLPRPGLLGNLGVNLSGQSVHDCAFQSWALAQLEQAGPAVCRRLTIEITETSAVTNLAEAAAFFVKLRALGLRVALDDFGAGASSFGYLKNLPVDFLKIDGQFVRNLVSDALNDVAVRCFVDVARVMGLQSVAEYVEDAAVLGRLRVIGVDHVQGNFLHQPRPLDRLLGP